MQPTEDDLLSIKKIVDKLLAGEYQLSTFCPFEFSTYELIGLLYGIMADLNMLREPKPISHGPVLSFLLAVANSYYHAPYHSFYHCIDVTFFLYWTLKELKLKGMHWLNLVDISATVIAAIGHDLLHPGRNNVFQIQINSDIAIKYNYESVLENQSIDHLFHLLAVTDLLSCLNLSTGNNSIDEELFFSIISSSIINTDMRYHFKLTESLNSLVQTLFSSEVHVSSAPQDHKNFFLPLSEVDADYLSSIGSIISLDELPPLLFEQKLIILHTLLHVADISNPLRSFEVSQLWSDKVIEEFWAQGDEERILQFSTPTPNMDRNTSNPYQLTIDFIDYVVKPFMEVYVELFPCFSSLLDSLLINRGKLRILLHSYSFNDSLSVQTNIEGSIAKGTNRRLSLAAGTIDIPEKIPVTIRRKQKNSGNRLSRKGFLGSNHYLKISQPNSSSETSLISLSRSWSASQILRDVDSPCTFDLPANASDEELYLCLSDEHIPSESISMTNRKNTN